MSNVQDFDLKGKRVLMRVDFNVPLNADGSISDDTRIRESLPTIIHILDQGASLILMSHLGRPKGKDSKLSLSSCATALSNLIQRPVLMAPDCIGEKTTLMAKALQPGQVLLLENLRFYPAEEKPSSDPTFAEQLSRLANVYINDAFGTAHRAHSSTATITRFFPNKAAAGLLMQKEISFLGSVIHNPKHPFFAIIGGAKIASKIGALHSLLNKADAIFIGGAMAHTFLKIQGMEIGKSLFEPNQLDIAKQFLQDCSKKNVPIYLPTDLVITDAITENANYRTISISDGIPPTFAGVDIGPATVDCWKAALAQASTVFWNGPLGVFECPPFAKGTQAIAETLASLKAITIVGGGDSIAAIHQLHLEKKFSHLSTGGGASLEYLEFGHLPGIDALS